MTKEIEQKNNSFNITLSITLSYHSIKQKAAVSTMMREYSDISYISL